jgi:hypothetical protein
MVEQIQKGHRTALEEALEAFAEVQAERAEKTGDQLDLFGEDPARLPKVAAPRSADGTYRGRRPGARGRRTDELARFYIAQNDGRDPLERGIEIAGLPILAKGVLEGLAERIGCTRHEAAKFWASILATTLPYTHQRQATLEVRPSGSPGSGQPVLWQITQSGELFDATHEDGLDNLRDVTPSVTPLENG